MAEGEVKVVRIIQTHHIEVPAEYGDDEQTLKDKAEAKLTKSAVPDNQQVYLLPEGGAK